MKNITTINYIDYMLVCMHILISPWNMGETFQIETTPELAYWPKDSSINTKGIPVMNNIRMKGIRNAPVEVRAPTFRALLLCVMQDSISEYAFLSCAVHGVFDQLQCF